MPAFKNAPKKVKSKNHKNMNKNEDSFFRGNCLSRRQGNKHKNFILILIFWTIFFCQNSTFLQTLNANAKKLYIFKHLKKVIFYQYSIYHSPLDSR